MQYARSNEVILALNYVDVGVLHCWIHGLCRSPSDSVWCEGAKASNKCLTERKTKGSGKRRKEDLRHYCSSQEFWLNASSSCSVQSYLQLYFSPVYVCVCVCVCVWSVHRYMPITNLNDAWNSFSCSSVTPALFLACICCSKLCSIRITSCPSWSHCWASPTVVCSVYLSQTVLAVHTIILSPTCCQG